MRRLPDDVWLPLQQGAVEALELWKAGLQEPPSELLDLCLDLMETHKVKHQNLYATFWADREEADPWPFGNFCILGAVTALYLLAWGASSKGDLPQAEYFLMAGISMLRMDDHDFFEHSGWPFTSFDLLSNVFFLRHGWPFQLVHVKPADSPWIRQRLPLVWPSHAPRCWPHCPNEFQEPGLEHKLRKLKVWWTSKHPGPFVDFAFVLENWMSDRYDVEVSHHALGDICVYARYKDWLCSKDQRLKEVMEEQRILNQITQSDCGEERGQWCGLRELHQEFDSKVLPRFQQLFPELRQMDMLACGHPLYWCRLLANFGAPLLGIWDMSHQLWVPEELQDQWTEDFLELFHRKENVLLTMSAHNSFQVRWLLGLKVPYFQPINPDVSLEARYAPEVRPQEVFVSRFNTPYDVELLRRFAEAAPLPFRFVSWEEMPCGKHCSKAQLAQFRGSVLCAYDTGPLKLAEFYAMAIPIFIFSGGLWRTTMRWARADAKPAGPVAFSLGRDFRDPHPKNFQWLERALRNETESLHWEDPWHPQLTPDLYQGPPYVDLPYSPYFQDRAELITPGAAFWAQLTDWALLPHLLRYESVPQLLQMLLDLSLDQLQEISRQMVSHYTKLLVASTNFWRAVVMSLVEDGDASKWKG